MKLFLLLILLLIIPLSLAQQSCEDGDVRSCPVNKGICSGSTQTCFNGIWSACSVTPNEIDICGNRLDDDCDGLVDENCVCAEGTTEQCGASDIGQCKKGIKICTNGEWTQCAGIVEPVEEI